MRKAVIGVMGGSKASPDVRDMAYRLGGLIAQRGWILLNGGRNKGVMAASAAGAKDVGGIVIGILPDRTAARASPHLDVAIVTAMGDARNLINVLSSDVVVACPGGLGTLTEIALAIKHKKPVILLGHDAGGAFDAHRRGGRLEVAEQPEQTVELIEALLRGRSNK